LKGTKLLGSIAALEVELATQGFLLCDVKSAASLPKSVWLGPKPKQYESGSFLLVGHAGKKFWEVFSQSQTNKAMQQPDPVDCYSAKLSKQAIENHLLGVNAQQLFPATDCPINLMALGKAFGWHSRSPLGMGIHKEYGLWSAYRAVWWLDLQLPDELNNTDDDLVLSSNTDFSDLCLQCKTQACVNACPAEAIDFKNNPDLGRCADYRLQDESQCESTCLSRMACPYAKEHRYTESQMSYHYELARSAIAKYRKQSQ
jgi:hypothetical protein